MTPRPIPAEEPVTISLKQFALRAAARPEVAKSKILPEQFAAAMGGISNLYMARASARNASRFRVETVRGFTSEEVPRGHIVQEIHNSTGVNAKVSERVLEVLEATLRSFFAENPGVSVDLKCLGIIRPKSAENSTYILEFQDPAAR